jgi:hypothetical protein
MPDPRKFGGVMRGPATGLALTDKQRARTMRGPRFPARKAGCGDGMVMEMTQIDDAAGRRRLLVTGATGLLGSHLAERLTARGDRVRALVRHGSRTEFLESLGVEIVRGDLTDPRDCDAALDGAAQVYHCAAKVGDWGTWPEFQRGCMDATRPRGCRSVPPHQLDERLRASR